jgi:N-acetylglutamate synthase-like GNAT family acetyltransferase
MLEVKKSDFSRQAARKKIRFFQKIGFFTTSGAEKKSDFFKKSDFSRQAARKKIRFFQKIGFFTASGTEKNPIFSKSMSRSIEGSDFSRVASELLTKLFRQAILVDSIEAFEKLVKKHGKH